MIELVLLGHRLLRQAEVGEGAVAVFVEDEPRDAALSKLEQVREPFFDLDSTRLAAPADAPGHEHTSTVKLAVLVNLHGAEVLPLVKPPTPRRGHRGDALGAVGIELDVPDELDVDVRPIDSTEIPAFPVRVDGAHKVQVLGHRLLRQAHGFEGFVERRVLAQFDGHAVANLEYVGLRHRDLVGGTPDSTSQHRWYYDVVASVKDVLDIEPGVLEGVGPLLEQRANGIVAAINLAIGQVGAGVPLDVRSQEPPSRFTEPVGLFVTGPDQLHVLMRHRLPALLVQARRPQRLGVVEEGPHTRALAIAKMEDHPHGRVNRDAAAASPAHHPPEIQNTVAEVAMVISNREVALQSLTQPSDVGFDALPSREDLSLDRGHHRDPLEFPRHQIDEGINIAPVEGVPNPFGVLHVRLRHRLPAFLGEAFGGSTGLVDVGAGREAFDEPASPNGHGRGAKLNERAAASWPTTRELHDERHAVAEIAELLRQLLVLLICLGPIFKDSAYRLAASKAPTKPPADPVFQTASGANMAKAASKSRRLTASLTRQAAASRSGVVDSSDITPPVSRNAGASSAGRFATCRRRRWLPARRM